MAEENTVFVKLVASSVWGKTTGILYVGWKDQEDFRKWLENAYHEPLDPTLPLNELVQYYAVKHHGDQPGSLTGHLLTLEQYQEETGASKTEEPVETIVKVSYDYLWPHDDAGLRRVRRLHG